MNKADESKFKSIKHNKPNEMWTVFITGFISK